MGLLDRFRGQSGETARREPHLSFGSWDRFPTQSPRVVQVCHPDWRGVKAAAYAFGAPVIEVDDLHAWGRALFEELTRNDVEVVVIQGWPPGSREFVESCARAGLMVKCLLHSSPALQGDSAGEAAVIGDVLGLLGKGLMASLGTTKGGVIDAYAAIGHALVHVPNRAPVIGEVVPLEMETAPNLGVFGEPWWPKNIATQALGSLMLSNSTVHLSKELLIDYLPEDRVVIHGELDRQPFLSLLKAMDVNLNATFTECHPMQPSESYLLGVPCLISRNSILFRDDPELLDMTTVSSPDEPVSIADGIRRLLRNKEELVPRAVTWIENQDAEAGAAWTDFVQG